MANREGIEALFAQWAWSQDSRQIDLVRDSLTPDARLSIDIEGAQAIEPLEGPAVGDFIEASLPHLTGVRRHVVTNLHLEDETDDSASAIAYLTVMVTEDGQLFPQTTGVYHADVVKNGEKWRFRKIHLELDRPF